MCSSWAVNLIWRLLKLHLVLMFLSKISYRVEISIKIVCFGGLWCVSVCLCVWFKVNLRDYGNGIWLKLFCDLTVIEGQTQCVCVCQGVTFKEAFSLLADKILNSLYRFYLVNLCVWGVYCTQIHTVRRVLAVITPPASCMSSLWGFPG